MKNLYYILVVFIPLIFLFTSCDKTEISSTQAESFVKHFGGSGADLASNVVQLSDGGFAIIGSIETSNKGYEIYLMRTDKYGNLKWEPQQWGGTLDDKGYDLSLDSDDNLILLGSVEDTTTFGDIERDARLIKVNDSDGSTLWTQDIGSELDEEACDLLINQDGSYIIGGYSNNGTDKDIWISKIQNDSIRSKKYGSIGTTEEIKSLVEISENGGFLAIGNSISGSEYNIQPMLFNSDLNYIGGEIYKRNGSDEAGNLLNSNNSYITISSSKNASNNSIVLLSIVSITNDFPQITPFKDIESQEAEIYGNSICSLSTGGYAIVGSAITAGNEDIYLLITDSQGNVVNSNTFGGTGTQVGLQIQQTSDGGFIILGLNTFDNNSMITLIKTKPDGSL